MICLGLSKEPRFNREYCSKKITPCGHGEEAGFFVAAGQADGAALVLVEGGAFLPDGFNVLSTADEAVNDEGEHGAEGVAGVGEVLQGVAK